MPKIAIADLPVVTRTGYPGELSRVVEGRARRRLGDAVGLTQFGVNLTTIPPGCATALRHWHEEQDELVFVLEGELVLIENEGETLLKAGEAAGFKAGVANGHHLVNRSDAEAVLLEIGSRTPTERAHYSDVDLELTVKPEGNTFTDRSGRPLT
jgi:uncharacterized cupin superfamily protein